jgi:hypothetical protein
VVVASFKVQCQDFSEGNKENYEKPQSGYPIFDSGFELVTPCPQGTGIRNANHSTRKSGNWHGIKFSFIL